MDKAQGLPPRPNPSTGRVPLLHHVQKVSKGRCVPVNTGTLEAEPQAD